MIETKFLEIRDHGTLVPALAIRIEHDPLAALLVSNATVGEIRANAIIARGGFHRGSGIYLMRLSDARAQCDPYEWVRDRTHAAVHHWLYDHWAEVSNGDLLDVRVILGEATEPAPTELHL